ncbi:hypothetical protein FD33_GL002203 [Companilactobacillus paralimentarius DSM 13238 = JCM 10415]|uniref:Uncharacterized protein n=1 Tax=Companilactobacillus paralimentarius DSM 13238 = JCM 10415 TaxID=1122151 RepID=A0A0R1PFV4_9LACO|nr:hypothetical protein [Companilactobacillus paralimentarius]KAE9564526.1 hypothetical protein ATN96_08175 [Companilactobacillus paralimentarius]KAE9564946.1 hypothetical protein ATN96_06045 [Companilactobacillus paralimentarius]KRL31222.1 hypothetical protein FD33_GL002203 [Companilactobacillus paralimentarius DSM 13238 = JCM 10415]QFR70111.1 hypothetical protein LP238_10430 [Companilactobacillus paralimentarius]
MTDKTKQMYQIKIVTAYEVSGGYISDNNERATRTQKYINDVCNILMDNDCTVLDIENAHSFPIVIKYMQPIE